MPKSVSLRKKPWWPLAAMLLTLAMMGMFVVVAPVRAEAMPRTCPEDFAEQGNLQGSRCINGVQVVSRGTISGPCFAVVLLPVIPRGLCSDTNIRQAERIAQARLIKRMSIEDGELLGGISPQTQWEAKVVTNTGAANVLGEPDVFHYQLNATNPATNPVDVWEVKLDSNGGVPAARIQLNNYVTAFATEFGWRAARPGITQAAYVDEFEVEGYLKCPDGRTMNGRYRATVPEPGIVLVSELTRNSCGKKQQTNATGQQETVDVFPVPVDTSVPADPTDPGPDPNPTGGNKQPAHIEWWQIQGVARGVVTAKNVLDILLARHDEICVYLAEIGPHRQRTSTSDAGNACLTAEMAMQETISALGSAATQADYAKAASFMLPALLLLVQNGTITMQDLADALGIDVASATQLVATSRARASGDPHLITLDGLNYDLQAVGEFVLASVPADGAEIQARFTATTPNLSSVNSLAFGLGGSAVELGPDGSVRIDGELADVPDGQGFVFDDGSYLVRSADSILVEWPNVDKKGRVALTWQPRNGIGFVGLSIPQALAGSASGLLGNFDGDPQNDLRLRDGTQLESTVSTAYVHDSYADSWRVFSSESFFTYQPGQSTASFTDKSFPQSIVTRGDFTDVQRAAAMATCQAYGVAAGPSFDDCELDILATGNWAYAAAAAKVHVPSIAAGDKTVDSTGYVGENFEGSVQNNFGAIRVGEEGALSTFAGPYSGTEQYRFYIPQLPGHDVANLSFDLLAFGTWGANDTVDLKIDDEAVTVALNWDQAETGTLPNGTNYRKLRVYVPVMHHLSQIAGTFTGSGLTSVGGKGFGIDNVSLTLNLVPVQQFAATPTRGVAVPLDSRLGQDGAGRLESRGAVDQYKLQLPAGADLFLDWQSRASSIGWRVLDASGATLKAGLASAGNVQVSALPGDVSVEVYAVGAKPPVTQDYGLSALWVPAPQSFAVDLSAGAVTVTDGSLGAGSGNLETKKSVDEYAFSVAEGGSRVLVDFLSGVSYWFGRWQLVDAGGVEVKAGSLLTGFDNSQWRFDQVLPAGQYRLRFSSESEVTGTYSVRIYQPPASQDFAIAVGSAEPTSISDGVPGVGGGNLETRVSRDVYSFTAAAGDSVFLDVRRRAENLRWELRDGAGQVVAQNSLGASQQIDALTGGSYTFEVFVDPADTTTNAATYALSLLKV